MSIQWLRDDQPLPSPRDALGEGIVAIGGTPTPERLFEAYSTGIFPWPHDGLPLLWFSPDPRFVLPPGDIHLHKSLKKRLRKGEYTVRADTDFAGVMRGCQDAFRPGQDGTWITDEMIAGYTALHELGFAHSIETWKDDQLVGGLYGVSIGGMFFGESMFARASDASKVAFATLAANLLTWGFNLIDCQVHTEHLERFGAVEIPRPLFLDLLDTSLVRPTKRGQWTLDVPATDVWATLQAARADATPDGAG